LLSVASSARVTFGDAAASADRTLLVVGTIAVIPGGQLDVGDNDMDVTATGINMLLPLIAAGFNFGSWNGPGITSSSAAADSSDVIGLGIVVNNQSGTALFSAGNPFDGVTPGPADVLVKSTYVGDANLDGKVDGSDYALIDVGVTSKGKSTGWLNGDFNYDSAVDGSDYALIDNAFNNQRMAISPTAV
jgi:hypothetical protein